MGHHAVQWWLESWKSQLINSRNLYRIRARKPFFGHTVVSFGKKHLKILFAKNYHNDLSKSPISYFDNTLSICKIWPNV